MKTISLVLRIIFHRLPTIVQLTIVGQQLCPLSHLPERRQMPQLDLLDSGRLALAGTRLADVILQRLQGDVAHDLGHAEHTIRLCVANHPTKIRHQAGALGVADIGGVHIGLVDQDVTVGWAGIENLFDRRENLCTGLKLGTGGYSCESKQIKAVSISSRPGQR